MFAKTTGMIFVAMTIVMAYNACAQWSPGGTVVYMGDLNLAGATGTGGAAPYTIGSAQASQPALNNSSLNNTTSSTAAIGASGLVPLDLSGYGSDRVNKNLAKYKNIMYPIAESRGSTASTSGGASGGGGCGC
ncbi:MAG: hypothetical protein EHM14_03640 [Methanothrix sp.]|nr:MAG: hypothetical protein EHM14_03640 [Methanothrix sp.]